MEELDKDGENLFKSAEFANNIRQMIVQKREYFELVKFYAELRAEKYRALIEAGFNDAQALHIVTSTAILG